MVASQDIDGETILIHFDSGRYYCANATGSAVFRLVAAGTSTSDISAKIAAAFQVTDQDIPALIGTFLSTAVREGLLVPAEPITRAAPAAPTPALVGGIFVAPALEQFDDLQDLLMLDPIHDVDALGWPVPPPPGDSSTIAG